jgi:hypothetical protein
VSFTVLTNVRLFVGGADFTGASNKVELSAMVEDKERTTYGDGGWKTRLGGLADTELASSGFWEAGDPGMVDDAAWAGLGGTDVWSVAPVGASVGDPAQLTKLLRCDYKPFSGGVGDVAGWESSGKGNWPLARGAVAHPPGTARTSSGTGTGVQLGAVPAGSRLYAALHVLSASGSTPTLDVVIESDDANGFASAVTQLTFTQATGRGGEILRTTGSAIADTWWRAKWTIGGGTPSFLFAVVFGIGR